MTMTAQDMALVGELSGPVGAVVQQAYTEEQGADFATAAGGVMCTGPYQLDDWTVGEGLTFVRNDAYWDTSLPMQLKSITIKGVPDEAVLTSGLLTGEIDGTYPITLSTLDQLRGSDAVNVYRGSRLRHLGIHHLQLRRCARRQAGPPGTVDGDRSPGPDLGALQGRRIPGPGRRRARHVGLRAGQFTAAWNELPDVSTPNLEEAKRLVNEAGAAGQTVRLGMSSELTVISGQAARVPAGARVDRHEGRARVGVGGELHQLLHRSRGSRTRRRLLHGQLPELRRPVRHLRRR